jgi:hypothetical protein
LNRPGAAPVAVPAPDAAGAELPPPMPENMLELGALEVAVPLPAVAVVAPLVAVALPGIEAAGVPPNKELPPVDPAGFDAAPPNKPGVGGAEDAGVPLFPPRLNPPKLEGGCEDAVFAGVAPRPKLGALLAGVALG